MDLEACLRAITDGLSGLRPLGESDIPHPEGLGDLPCGWVADRSLFKGRRYGAAGNAAIHVAREAVAAAQWSKEETRNAWLYVGTSRGNAGERAGAWSARRPVKKFAASNTMHSEIAAAVSLQLGIDGPWQVLSNGCAAGLDALGHAAIAVALGWTRRALVIAVDLPLIRPLIEDFASTGLLSTHHRNDPYSPETAGFFPGEGIAAMALETPETGRRLWAKLLAYAANNDGHDAIGLPPGGNPLAELMRALAATSPAALTGLSPHATGTAAHRISETAALNLAFSHRSTRPDLFAFKPFTGHALGASGLVDAALLAGFFAHGQSPANARGLTPPSPGWSLPEQCRRLGAHETYLKIAAGMGGHNAGVILQSPVL
jgi:3-oxoacyl-[acyl-carrier-protein] synthase II